MNQGSDTDAAVVVDADGVSVEKRYTADEFPVPAVKFTLRSERDIPAEFSLVDQIPEECSMDRIGFHPEYDNDGWTAYQDHRVEYRCRLDPDEERTTVYGVRTDDPDGGAKFLDEPAVEEVDQDADPAGSIADVIGADSSQVVRDVLSGDREAVPGGESPGNAGLDLSAAEADLDDPEAGDNDPLAADAESGDAEAEEAEAEGEAEADAGDDPAVHDAEAVPEGDADEAGTDDEQPDGLGAAADADGIAAALAAELRAGGVPAEDRETLRRELELDHSTSVDARISRLQSNVADVAAYADALEEFLDDNGTAEELTEGLRGDVDDLRESIAAVEADVSAADDRRGDLESGLDDVREDVEGLDDDLSAAAADLESGLGGVRADLDDLAAEVEGEDDAVADVRDDVASLEEEVESLSGLVDEEANDVRDELAEIRTEMEEFEVFRDRLSSAFGAGGTGADDSDDEE